MESPRMVAIFAPILSAVRNAVVKRSCWSGRQVGAWGFNVDGIPFRPQGIRQPAGITDHPHARLVGADTCQETFR